ncbi:hypothetical protein BBJ28_00005326 [Nothophytophthora sp. Chile5]|nr:hypothetical protein BBJ28_00005326 [Nothophytophthora sp. Chile5]
MNHPNIIHIEDVFLTDSKICMVTEYMSGGELFDYVVDKGTLSEVEASAIVRKITSAVAYMHACGIIHRDLKPENLMLTSKSRGAEVKIIDFGLAKLLDADDKTASFLGTRGYLAPEMLQRQAYSRSVDMWALGIIVYVLLCGCLPFDDDGGKIANEKAARVRDPLSFLYQTDANLLSECDAVLFVSRRSLGCASLDGLVGYRRARRICSGIC